MGVLLGLIVYFVALVVFTAVILRNREFTRKSVIFLVIAWIPFLVFGGAMLLMLAAGPGGNILGALTAWLVLAGPIFLIIGGIFLVTRLMTIWRG